MQRPIETAPFVGMWGSVPSCDIEDLTSRESFYRLRTEMSEERPGFVRGMQTRGLKD